MLVVLGICTFFTHAQHALWFGLNPFAGMALELSILVIGVPGLFILIRYVRSTVGRGGEGGILVVVCGGGCNLAIVWVGVLAF